MSILQRIFTRAKEYDKMIENNPVAEIVKAFIVGEMDIDEFMQHFNESDEIAHFLEDIVDLVATKKLPLKRRTVCYKGVAQNKPFEARSQVEIYIKEYAQSFVTLGSWWKENPPKVGDDLRRESHKTAMGASNIHSTVADIYYQIDQTLVRTTKYRDEAAFALDVLPGHLAGGVDAENYVSQYIMPKYPATMKKGERKKLVKEEIKTAFLRDCKGYPHWIQSPEWPMGCDGKPMIYTGQKKFSDKKYHDDYAEYYFRDAVTGEKHTVTQWW